MKAAVYTEYGPPEVLRIEEVDKPAPKDDEVLVKVHAASLNSWDWDLLTGKPLIRITAPFKPQYRILGADIAGRVEAVGRDVERFRPGDEVFGDLTESGWGGLAEHVCAREGALVLKPAGMGFEEAAAMPQAALLALQGLRGRVQPGQKVLINGAGGGVGTFAVQLAKLYGAEVTGVDHAAKLEVMRSAGADHVIDYTREDFTRSGERYDLILDMVAQRSIGAYRRALNPGGAVVIVGGATSVLLRAALLGSWILKGEGKKIGVLVWRPSTSDLEHMKELFAAGKVMPVIDRRFPLSEAAEALRYLGEGHARGKVVVTMAEEEGAG